MRKPGMPVALLLAGLALSVATQAAPASAAATRGQALFAGAAPLAGRIVLHPNGLPPEVLRCANCHEAAGGPPVARTVAPALTRAGLMAPSERRGGPPSAYDEDGFCRLLRTGQDPAKLIVNVQMPRYDISAADCRALWRHLTEPGHG